MVWLCWGRVLKDYTTNRGAVSWADAAGFTSAAINRTDSDDDEHNDGYAPLCYSVDDDCDSTWVAADCVGAGGEGAD